jgi:hypothetical protein
VQAVFLTWAISSSSYPHYQKGGVYFRSDYTQDFGNWFQFSIVAHRYSGYLSRPRGWPAFLEVVIFSRCVRLSCMSSHAYAMLPWRLMHRTAWANRMCIVCFYGVIVYLANKQHVIPFLEGKTQFFTNCCKQLAPKSTLIFCILRIRIKVAFQPLGGNVFLHHLLSFAHAFASTIVIMLIYLNII